MAALCSVARSLTKTLLLGAARQAVSRQSGSHLQRSLTWSQLKRYCSQTTAARQSPTPRRWSWWLTMVAGAGFTQGFLGFSFGKKDDEKSDPLLRVFREAKEAQMMRDFNKAEIRYHDALKVADEMLKLKKITMKTYIYARTNVFDALADMALGLGQLEKAEGLYKETMKGCLQQGLPQDDNSIVELSIKVASIYAMMDKRTEAEEGLLFCINAQDAKMKQGAATSSVGLPSALKDVAAAASSAKAQGKVLSAKDASNNAANTSNNAALELDAAEISKDTEALLGMALETYGRFLMGHRRLSESVPVFERALGIAGKVLGTQHEQTLVLMNDLATAHILLRQYDEAVKILNSAIESGVKVKSAHLPVLYCNLGAVFLRSSKLDQAEEACQKGKELSRGGGQHSPGYSMAQKCLQKIGEVRNKDKA